MDNEQFQRVTTAVTQHLVDEVTETNLELFKPNGVQNVNAVLCYLGFDIRPKLDNRKAINDRVTGQEVGYEQYNAECRYNALIRSSQFPTKCYRTKIYKGFLRNAANLKEEYNPKGEKYFFDKSRHHHLGKLYEKVGVLQSVDVLQYIKAEDLIEINSENFKHQ